jgi:hypothetical protein
MAEYRVYIIGPDGHFQNSVALDCADDDAAIEQAKQLSTLTPIPFRRCRPRRSKRTYLDYLRNGRGTTAGRYLLPGASGGGARDLETN